MGDVVQFEFNEPVEVALKFAEPKMLETKYGERAMYSLADNRVMFHDTLTAAKIRALGVQPGDCFFIVKRKKGRIQEFEVSRDSDEPAPAKARITVGEEVIRLAQQPIESHPTGKKLPPVRDLSKVIDPRKFASYENLEQQLEDSIAQAEARKLGNRPDGTFAVRAEADARTPAPVSVVMPAMTTTTHANGSKPPAIATGFAQYLLEQVNTLTAIYGAALHHAGENHQNVKPDDIRSFVITAYIQAGKQAGRAA